MLRFLKEILFSTLFKWITNIENHCKGCNQTCLRIWQTLFFSANLIFLSNSDWTRYIGPPRPNFIKVLILTVFSNYQTLPLILRQRETVRGKKKDGLWLNAKMSVKVAKNKTVLQINIKKNLYLNAKRKNKNLHVGWEINNPKKYLLSR